MEEMMVLRWGGIAGMLGGIVMILTIVALVSSTFSTAPADPAAQMAKYPDIRTTLAVAETLYLVAACLWSVLFLTLYKALRREKAAPALFGTLLGILGVAMLLVGAITYVAFDPISQLYHASGASTADQQTLVLAWQAVQGVFNETDTVGFLLVSVGYVILGLGMLKAPSFGRVFGLLTVIFGLVGAVGISLFSVTSILFAVFGILIFVILPLALGWKSYRLSMAK